MGDQSCTIKAQGQPEIEVVSLHPENRVSGYRQALEFATGEAQKRFEEYMLVSWYDRDRDFESPPNTTECAAGCKKDGYIHYGMNHGAKLKVDIEDGRFVFFFTPVEW
jgi:hypothetical protein